MRQYLTLLEELLNAEKREDRTRIYTRSIFGTKLEFNLLEGFPILTTKKLHLKSIIYELLWFIKGDTNIKYLNDNGVKIWDEWADKNGDLGPIYGAQWNFKNQLQNAIDEIRNNPNSRRIIVNSWNVAQLSKMRLPPCHIMYQLYVNKLFLDLQIYQRSADIFLGVPFNIASYALLLSMIANITNLIPRKLIWVGGDTHLYENHVEQAKLQLKRKPYGLPILFLKDRKNIKDFIYHDIDIKRIFTPSTYKSEGSGLMLYIVETDKFNNYIIKSSKNKEGLSWEAAVKLLKELHEKRKKIWDSYE